MKKYKRIFAEQILGTPPKAPVALYDVLIGRIPMEVCSFLHWYRKFSSPEVYISTWSLKHAYDQRPEFTINYLSDLPAVFQEPDYISLPKFGDRGDFIFFRKFRERKFLACPIEICAKGLGEAPFCVTFFPTRPSYIKKSTIVWSREGGAIPPS